MELEALLQDVLTPRSFQSRDGKQIPLHPIAVRIPGVGAAELNVPQDVHSAAAALPQDSRVVLTYVPRVFKNRLELKVSGIRLA